MVNERKNERFVDPASPFSREPSSPRRDEQRIPRGRPPTICIRRKGRRSRGSEQNELASRSSGGVFSFSLHPPPFSSSIPLDLSVSPVRCTGLQRSLSTSLRSRKTTRERTHFLTRVHKQRAKAKA